MLEKQHDHKVKALHYDKGREDISEDLLDHLKKEGVILENISVNSAAEWSHREGNTHGHGECQEELYNEEDDFALGEEYRSDSEINGKEETDLVEENIEFRPQGTYSIFSSSDEDEIPLQQL